MRFKVIIALIIMAFVGVVIFNKPASKSAAPAKPAAGNFSALVGKLAPDFTLKDYTGNTFTLSQVRGKKVVLFFNEGIMCYPACWNQVSALGSDTKFNNSQVVTASVVPDMQSEWTEATRRMPELAKSTILLDSDNSVSNSYGMMYLPSSMHQGSKPGHTYVVIDAKGVVRYTYDDPKMGIENNLLTQELAKI